MRNSRIYVVATLVVAAIWAVHLSPAAAQSKYFRIGTAGSTGSWYAIGGALSKVIGENVSAVRTRVETTKGGYANVGLLAKGDVEVALVPPFLVSDAVKGIGNYAGKSGYPMKVGGWFSCCLNTLTVMVPKDSPIKTIKDLDGKSINMGQPGAVNRYILQKVVEVLGLKLDEMAISIGPAVNRLKNRQIDAVWWNASTPHGRLVDASVSLDVRVIGMGKASADKVVAKYPWLDHGVLPGGIYKGTPAPTSTLVSAVALVMQLSVDEEIAYQVTKAVFEHLDQLGQMHPVLKQVNLDNALSGITVPLHPGVYRYYKEKNAKGLAAFVKQYGKL